MGDHELAVANRAATSAIVLTPGVDVTDIGIGCGDLRPRRRWFDGLSAGRTARCLRRAPRLEVVHGRTQGRNGSRSEIHDGRVARRELFDSVPQGVRHHADHDEHRRNATQGSSCSVRNACLEVTKGEPAFLEYVAVPPGQASASSDQDHGCGVVRVCLRVVFFALHADHYSKDEAKPEKCRFARRLRAPRLFPAMLSRFGPGLRFPLPN